MKTVRPLKARELHRLYACAWTLAALYALMPLAHGSLGQFVLHPGAAVCFTASTSSPFLWATFVVIAVPGGYMAWAYGKMFVVVRGYIKKRVARDAAHGAIAGRTAFLREKEMAEKMRKEIKVLRMLILIVLIYALNWGVAATQFFYGGVGGGETPPLFSAMTALGAITNSAVNPPIYFAMNSRFREVVTATWRRLIARAARKLGLPDPVRYYDREAEAWRPRTVAPTGAYAGPATQASTVAPSAFDPEQPGAPTDGRRRYDLAPLRTVHEAPTSVDLAAGSSWAAETSGGGPSSSSAATSLEMTSAETQSIRLGSVAATTVDSGRRSAGSSGGALRATSLRSSKNTGASGGGGGYTDATTEATTLAMSAVSSVESVVPTEAMEAALRKLKLKKLIPKFAAHGFNDASFGMLDREVMTAMGVPFGPQLQIESYLKKNWGREKNDDAVQSCVATETGPAHGHAVRRIARPRPPPPAAASSRDEAASSAYEWSTAAVPSEFEHDDAILAHLSGGARTLELQAALARQQALEDTRRGEGMRASKAGSAGTPSVVEQQQQQDDASQARRDEEMRTEFLRAKIASAGRGVAVGHGVRQIN